MLEYYLILQTRMSTLDKAIILGIESSCDDTSAAVICNGKVLSNVIANQLVHHSYGGVVPELASRAHQKNILPVIHRALSEAKVTKKDISAIAFTSGPGLLGSLLVGASLAKSLALALHIPLIEVNHIQAHILAHFIEHSNMKKPKFPFLCLTVSGGHTQIVEVKDYFNMQVIGQTIDDAAGEAFDKAAKILGLPYPGGPWIDKYAQLGEAGKFEFNRPSVKDLDFSFSGLKTNILYFVQNRLQKNSNFIKENLNDICASLQYTIVDILMKKLEKACKQTQIHTVAIAGGVAANSGIRSALAYRAKKYDWDIHIPEFEYCTDNAAMIAIVGYYKYLIRDFIDMSVTSNARMKL